MGLQDLLAVVLGVKTAEALQQRKANKQTVAHMQSPTARNRWPTAGVASDFFQEAYEQIEDVVIDDLGRAMRSGSDPEDALAVWAASAKVNLAEPRRSMVKCRGWDPTADLLIEQILQALRAYHNAAQALIAREPDGRELLDRASSEWKVVQSVVQTTGGF